MKGKDLDLLIFVDLKKKKDEKKRLANMASSILK